MQGGRWRVVCCLPNAAVRLMQAGGQLAKSWCGALESGVLRPVHSKEGSRQMRKRRKLESGKEVSQHLLLLYECRACFFIGRLLVQIQAFEFISSSSQRNLSFSAERMVQRLSANGFSLLLVSGIGERRRFEGSSCEWRKA